MSSKRSKRRKIKNELDLISNIYSNNEPVISSSIVNVNCEKEITKPIDCHSPITTNLNPDPQIVSSFYDKTVTRIQEKLPNLQEDIIGEQHIPLLSNVENLIKNKLNNNFGKDLATWAVNFNVP